MNIVYLNHYAGSPDLGMEYRPYYLAREWVRAGHRVHMVAASYSHVRTRQPEPGAQSIDGIEYHWVRTPAYRGNGPARAFNIWTFLSTVWRDTARMVRDWQPDVVIASSTYPMDIWAARRLARQAGAKLVYEVHDLWPLSPRELFGMPRWHPFIVMCQAAEDQAYRDADRVVSMLPKVHEHMAARGLDLQKLSIVPNGITLEEWQQEAEPLAAALQHTLTAAREGGKTLVGYAGSHGKPNALDNLLEAARLLKSDPMHFVLIGDGHEKQRLMARVQAEGLHNVSLLPAIPKAQIPSFLRAIDIAYIGWQRVPIYRFGIAPNKLMDYMMAACPVVHAVEAGNDPVAEAGCGITVAPESPGAVAEALRRMAAMSSDERADMGARGRAYVLTHHTYPILAAHFMQAMEASA
jgi:glycosyltransferase involved in cell wall biosynthesis